MKKEMALIMKQIEVVAAIIHDDEGRIFATQRGYGDYKAAGISPGVAMTCSVIWCSACCLTMNICLTKMN